MLIQVVNLKSNGMESLVVEHKMLESKYEQVRKHSKFCNSFQGTELTTLLMDSVRYLVVIPNNVCNSCVNNVISNFSKNKNQIAKNTTILCNKANSGLLFRLRNIHSEQFKIQVLEDDFSFFKLNKPLLFSIYGSNQIISNMIVLSAENYSYLINYK